MCGAVIDNEFYKELGERWHTSEGDAVALLRRENETKSPWVIRKILERGNPHATVLDIGCGGGFLTLALIRAGFRCTGLDVAESVLASGRARDVEKKANWIVGDALNLPFEKHSFDAVCIMDVLEHVPDPRRAVQEALRVLKPGGTFLFHTFNRTPMAWLFAAKGLDWFLRDSQTHVHDWKMFIKPRELESWIQSEGFSVSEWQGIHPTLKSVLKLVFTRKVPADFAFDLGGPLLVGYLGVAHHKC